MKRISVHRRKAARLPTSWREAEYAALRFNAADNCDDRVSENIYDADDERAEVDTIIHGMTPSAD